MCSPGLAVFGGAMALGGISAYQEQKAQNAALEYNAKLAERNAEVSEMQAKQAGERGELEEKQLRARTSRIKGEQRTAFARSGAAVDEGSSLDVLLDTAKFGEMDALTVRYNAEVEAWGYREEAEGYRGAAALSRMQRRDPWQAAATSLLGGASQLGAAYAMQPSGGGAGSPGVGGEAAAARRERAYGGYGGRRRSR